MSWGAQPAGATVSCRYLDSPLRDAAQPGPAERFQVRAPISPAGSWGPKILLWGALKTSAQVCFRSGILFQEREFVSGLGFPPPPSLLHFSNTSPFLRFRKGSCRALHQRSGAVLKGGTRSLTPALLRDLLCLCKALHSALASQPAEGNAAGSRDLFCC